MSKRDMARKARSSASRPSGEDIAAQLGRILSHATFRRAPKLTALLRFLADTSIDDTTEPPTERMVARDVFGAAQDFKPTEESKVRVAVHRLRLALTVYYFGPGRNDPVVFSLQPGSYALDLRYASDCKSNSQFADADDGSLKAHKSHQLAHAYWAYQACASPESHADVFQKFRLAAEEKPENATLHAVIAELALDGRAVGLLDAHEGFDIASASIEQARILNDDNPHLLISRAFAAIAEGDLAGASEAADQLQQFNEEPRLSAMGVWFKYIGSSNRTISNGHLLLFEKTSDVVSWFCLATFLQGYRNGDYEKALTEAIRFGMPDFMWGPLLRAAAFGQLGLRGCASREVERLKQINSSFEERPLQYLKCYLPFDEDAEHVLEGLRRAGIQSPHARTRRVQV